MSFLGEARDAVSASLDSNGIFVWKTHLYINTNGMLKHVVLF